MFTFIMVLSILICIIVVAVTALVTSKAYSFKHTVDPVDKKTYGNDINSNINR
ncbi:YtzI protein [Lederbergia lenta]|uniref:Tumour necrosis factor receptor superfamily member 19 n=1 Tax=Lederbergia lenta TaxID=1467 RepID=A0A2X4WNT0_LEDLE|nr:YtzI protein [Lederbergia lenta]MCM3113435.1 YtzI protein [Lederbergia lenta]MEC2326420.1 YtzI protein [Lederbergia lenta]SQI61368.1 Tumour necrosis factor receptor superfamily member 19 [Lederbergia lenta]